ncbi:fasciclin domain-containing protein [Oscillatoria sp. FACHB-1407]|uniref:fasciclin domain-containing protein n=1 Tax=Oscillatoria sp. FACHB-1407 TaxID=2692847 RepID=UPI0016820300|nr:fasciclin domain-containing protein [Oscillatoria sp. FACHB-1407]MBD2461472.1 fasciclin domain-containing protein [Oscillatoria sp. FACHB-1407]
MTKTNVTFRKLLVGLAGLGLATTMGACAAPESTSTAPTESPIAESVPESPIASQDSANTTLDQVVASDESFSTLNAAIQAAGLETTLSEPGPYTVFAPTNEAFEALPEGTVDQLLLPENREVLQQVLSYHVVPGNVTSADITPGEVTTVEGSPVNINTDAGEVTVGEATVVEPDIIASNGVVHGIDEVLLPPSFQAQ